MTFQLMPTQATFVLPMCGSTNTAEPLLQYFFSRIGLTEFEHMVLRVPLEDWLIMPEQDATDPPAWQLIHKQNETVVTIRYTPRFEVHISGPDTEYCASWALPERGKQRWLAGRSIPKSTKPPDASAYTELPIGLTPNERFKLEYEGQWPPNELDWLSSVSELGRLLRGRFYEGADLLQRMAKHGSSFTLTWDEEHNQWGCEWVTSGRRYQASKSTAAAAVSAVLARAAAALFRKEFEQQGEKPEVPDSGAQLSAPSVGAEPKATQAE